MFLYHRVLQEKMIGDILMPLNQLRESMPEVYRAAAAKYVGRESTMKRTIPGLDCLWNDVIQLCPLHPSQIMEQRIKAGLEWTQTTWYEIDPVKAGFDSSNATIWLMLPGGYNDAGELLKPEHFVPFSLEALGQFQSLTPEAIDAYRTSVEKKTTFLLFNRVPHVFFKGTIDITQHKVIEVLS